MRVVQGESLPRECLPLAPLGIEQISIPAVGERITPSQQISRLRTQLAVRRPLVLDGTTPKDRRGDIPLRGASASSVQGL